MTSTCIYDLAVQPELPPLSIGALAVALCDLFRRADGLAMPCYVTISVTQAIGLLFESEQASLRAITRWALRFGSAVTSVRADKDGEQRLLVRAAIDFYGVEVTAFAFIPVT